MLRDKSEEELRTALRELEEGERNAPLWDNLEGILQSSTAKQVFAECAGVDMSQLDEWFVAAYWEARKDTVEMAKKRVAKAIDGRRLN